MKLNMKLGLVINEVLSLLVLGKERYYYSHVVLCATLSLSTEVFSILRLLRDVPCCYNLICVLCYVQHYHYQLNSSVFNFKIAHGCAVGL